MFFAPAFPTVSEGQSPLGTYKGNTRPCSVRASGSYTSIRHFCFVWVVYLQCAKNEYVYSDRVGYFTDDMLPICVQTGKNNEGGVKALFKSVFYIYFFHTFYIFRII